MAKLDCDDMAIYDGGPALAERTAGIPRELWLSRARHIVRCVNSHEKLVEACRAAYEHWRNTDSPTGRQLRAALEAAGDEV